MTAKHQIDDDAKRPAVNTLVIRLLHEYLRSHIAESPVWLFASFPWPESLREAEIDELDFRVFIPRDHQDVLWLQVSVGDSKRVEVVNRSGQLMSDDASSILTDSEVLGVQVGEEVTAAEHFHDDVDVVLVLEYIVELDDVGVLADFQHFNLSFQQLQVLQL